MSLYRGALNWLCKLERYPSKPYIKEGFPGNKTVLVNSTVQFQCPPTSDLEPHLQWLRVYNYTITDLGDEEEENITQGVELQVISVTVQRVGLVGGGQTQRVSCY